MDKLTTLSQAIRYGSTFIEEGQCFGVGTLTQTRGACALGTAYIACDMPREASSWDIIYRLSQRFNVPEAVVANVSAKHFCGDLNRAQCADWLEAQGY